MKDFIKNRKRVRPATLILVGAVLVVAMALAASCEVELDSVSEGPMTFEVTFAQGTNAGTRANPLAFAIDEMELSINIRAIDHDGSTAGWFDGFVHLDMGPTGRFNKNQDFHQGTVFHNSVELKNGVAENVNLKLSLLHGQTYVWVEDACSKDNCYEGNIGSYATGLSPSVWVENPTIRNTQETELVDTSPLKGDFVQINTTGRDLIVTATTKDGFYVTDISEPDDIYNAIFVYNFSRPDDTYPGDKLSQLSGTSDEYYGFSELGFPSWKVVSRNNDLPKPITITVDMVQDDHLMEQYESRRAKVENVTVCAFQSEDEESSFNRYGQWKVALQSGDCDKGSIVIYGSIPQLPDVNPYNNAGDVIEEVAGNLRYHAVPKWMIYPSDIGEGRAGEGTGFDQYGF